jgi:PST family polysaccharide transporter
MLPIRPIDAPLATVAIPTLSRLQGEPQRYRTFYLKALSVLAYLTIPGAVFMIVMHRELILLVLGEKWVDAAPIFLVLGFNALLQPVLNTNGWLHVSLGRTDRMFRWGLVASAAIVASFFMGLPYGPMGVAVAYTAVSLALSPFALWYASRPSPVRMPDIVRAIAPGTLCAAIVAAALLALRLFLGRMEVPPSNLATVAAGFAVAALAYLVIVYLEGERFAEVYHALKAQRPVERT